MKNLYTFLFSFIFLSASAQFNFSDDFESYQVGDYIGVENTTWTTWSGATGNTEDAQVTSDNAASGSNSIYFSSSASVGGPQDVVLPFGEVFDEGNFSFSANFFIDDNSGAYFNFQAETTIGNTWALDCYMNDDGSLVLSTGGGATTFLSETYPVDSWFNLEISVNLTLNQWEVLMDGNSIGTFSNTINEVASLDLFPLTGHSFYIDDVVVSHTPFTPVGIDIILSELDLPSHVSIPVDVDIQGTVLNYGAETITSMDVVWSDGVNVFTDNLTGLSIATLETYDFIHPDPLSITTLDTSNITVTIQNINGGTDIDMSNNALASSVIGVEFVTQRTPLFEHFTSNTCGPCASFNTGFQTLLDANNVNAISDAKVAAIKYQVDWPGAADQSYNADVGTRVSYYNVDGVPNAHIDGESTSSSQAEIDDHRNMPSFLDIMGTAVASDGTDLAIDVTVKSYGNYPNNGTVHIAVVENEYTNNLGTNGETEFFQVMRKMIPSANGTTADLSYGTTTTISEMATFAVGNVVANSYRLWEGLGNCVVVVFVQDENNKQVIDSKIIEITGNTTVAASWDCVDGACIDPGTGNGSFNTLQDCQNKCTSDITFWDQSSIRMMPNPASSDISLSFSDNVQFLSVSMFSLSGQKVLEKNYDEVSSNQVLTYSIDHLNPSMYVIKIQTDDQVKMLHFVKQ